MTAESPPATRFWDDIGAGERFVTGQLGITEEEILTFAREFDPQPYHLDRAAADASIFGGLCASGWQATALMMRLLTDALREQASPSPACPGFPTCVGDDPYSPVIGCAPISP